MLKIWILKKFSIVRPFEDDYKKVILKSYSYQIIEDKPKVNKLDVPMKREF
jgi:hypothetical protein